MPGSDPSFEALLEYLKRTRGVDLTGYKRSTLMRRIQKRMQAVGVESYSDYIDYLEVHPDEFALLFNTILINVTGFFRDKSAWDFVASHVLPEIIQSKPLEEPIRVWCAGCASGEEAYSIAILLTEALGVESFRSRVKVYATDVDDEALTQARHGVYTARDVEDVPADLRERYFDVVNGKYAFRKDLRRSVIFGRNDLTQDAPISRLDLLICRNTLMYFNAEAQGRILRHFHFALNPGGVLFLGKAEMLLTHGDLFRPVDLRRRIFVKVPTGALGERRVIVPDTFLVHPEASLEEWVHAREAAFQAGPVAQIVVDRHGFLILANDRARQLFGLSPSDIGRPFQDLQVSYRPVELRPYVDQVTSTLQPATIEPAAWPVATGDMRWLQVTVTPLLDINRTYLGISVAFDDVTETKQLEESVQRSKEELETALEELQATVEELETTNEELQSTNEELETTNEELQSTNEELETMNEELQSTNEELETMNEELRLRTTELQQVNAFLESILSSLRAAVVVVDRDLRVYAWNRRAEDLWGLRAEEVRGEHFLNLDIGLPVDQLRQPLRACLSGERTHEEIVLEATNRRGKRFECRVTCSPLLGPARDIRGVILLMEELSEHERGETTAEG